MCSVFLLRAVPSCEEEGRLVAERLPTEELLIVLYLARSSEYIVPQKKTFGTKQRFPLARRTIRVGVWRTWEDIICFRCE